MSDIDFLSFYDPRLIQKKPKYAVDKGALSVTASKGTTNSQSNSQHSYNLNVPSLNVFVDRSLDWSSTVHLHLRVTTAGSTAGQYILNFGSNIALSAFPLHKCVSTLATTVNDTTITNNVSDIINELLRLTDFRKNRLMRTCPSQMDKYKIIQNGTAANNSETNGFDKSDDLDNWDNGAYYDVWFEDPTGSRLVGNGVYVNTGADAGNVPYNNGIPLVGAGAAEVATNATYDIYIGFRVTEKLLISPFIWCDSMAQSTGLFGIKNIQFTMTMQQPNRVLRLMTDGIGTAGTRTIASINYNSTGGFTNSEIHAQFLTPSLGLQSPPVSIVPYFNYSRSITNIASIGANTTPTIQSQTLTLSQVPDMLLIYVKPESYPASEGEWYFPIENINVTFDNYSGLLASMQPFHLFRMAVENGLNVDYNTFRGTAKISQAVTGTDPDVLLVGSPLVLRFGKDITLSEGLAPGVIGNFSFQVNVQVNNRSGTTYNNPKMYIIAVNSGMFETKDGQSRIIGAPLSERDVLDAPMIGTHDDLERMVGGSFWGKMKSALSKVGDFLLKPEVRKFVKDTARSMGPIGSTVANVGEALGYGVGGSSQTGGRRRLKLEDRLKI